MSPQTCQNVLAGQQAEQQQTAAAQFNQVHAQGLRKKQLFKEYLSRHRVIEEVEIALQQLFNGPELPGGSAILSR